MTSGRTEFLPRRAAWGWRLGHVWEAMGFNQPPWRDLPWPRLSRTDRLILIVDVATAVVNLVAWHSLGWVFNLISAAAVLGSAGYLLVRRVRTAWECPPGGALWVAPYVLVQRGSELGIRCETCGNTSWHEQDVARRFCAFCDVFHERQAFEPRDVIFVDPTPWSLVAVSPQVPDPARWLALGPADLVDPVPDPVSYIQRHERTRAHTMACPVCAGGRARPDCPLCLGRGTVPLEDEQP